MGWTTVKLNIPTEAFGRPSGWQWLIDQLLIDTFVLSDSISPYFYYSTEANKYLFVGDIGFMEGGILELGRREEDRFAWCVQWQCSSELEHCPTKAKDDGLVTITGRFFLAILPSWIKSTNHCNIRWEYDSTREVVQLSWLIIKCQSPPIQLEGTIINNILSIAEGICNLLQWKQKWNFCLQ